MTFENCSIVSITCLSHPLESHVRECSGLMRDISCKHERKRETYTLMFSKGSVVTTTGWSGHIGRLQPVFPRAVFLSIQFRIWYRLILINVAIDIKKWKSLRFRILLLVGWGEKRPLRIRERAGWETVFYFDFIWTWTWFPCLARGYDGCRKWRQS